MAKDIEQRFCPCCKHNQPITMFIMDYRQKGEFLPFCKTCTDAIVKQGEEKFGLAGGIWCGAMVNNVPMIKQVWDNAYSHIVELSPKSPFALYYRTLKDIYGDYIGVLESDCWVGDFVTIGDKEENLTPDELKQLIKDWGRFVDENGEIEYDAYDYLTQRYNDYTDNVIGLTNAMSMQFRNLCKAEWQKIKADESGDISEIDKAQKLVDRLLNALKLDDFAVEKSDTDRFIDRLIWRIEETEPAEEEDVKLYVDIAGYENMYNSIMRSMKNMIAGSRDYPEIPKDEM